VKQRLAKLFLRATGWTFEGEIPSERRFVLIAAPHTSNWDLIYLLAFAWYCNIDISWMGKHQIFAGPQGPLMKALGGIPVRRDRKNDLVSQMAQAFSERDSLVLTVPPEGTRKRAEYWKSGFYRIALAANVPIIPSVLDYGKRSGGFGPAFRPTGNVSKDMDVLRAFYAGRQGKHPADFGPIRLAEEDADERAVAGD
jgi:1-acyl-sn-glycerol-3-phosphate acyltransferase